MMDAENLDPRLRSPGDSAGASEQTLSTTSAGNNSINSITTISPTHAVGTTSAHEPSVPTEVHQSNSNGPFIALAAPAATAAAAATAPPPQPTSSSTTVIPTTTTKIMSAPHQHHQSLVPNTLSPSTPSAAATPSAVASASWNRPQSTLSPATPQSPPIAPDQPQMLPYSATVSYNPDGTSDPKRLRACEACRGLKVRCEPIDPANPDSPGPCKRCSKAGRQCIVTAPTRKRQKKADSRVAELEKKIDLLTASLASRIPPSSSQVQDAVVAEDAITAAMKASDDKPPLSASTHISYSSSGAQSSTPWSGPSPVPASQPPAMRELTKNVSPDSAHTVIGALKRKLAEVVPDATEQAETRPMIPPTRLAFSTSVDSPVEHNYSDVVDRGTISMDMAKELWDRYVDRMCPHLPAVVFPPGTTVADVRKNKPTLFLSIMTSASSEFPAVQKVLVKELMQIFAHKVLVVGEKYLELVQALHVAVIWYYPPDHFEELKFYQLVHMAAVMAIDIGLDHKRAPRSRRSWRDHPHRTYYSPNPTSVESRRTWLACYFLAANTSIALHRPNLVRWTPFMSESMDILRTSPEAAESDKYFCHLVWTHKIAEEIGVQFQLDDPSSTINITTNKTQHALRGFEYELERYSNSIPVELQQPSLKISFHVLSLYMHEMVLQSDEQEMIHPPMSRDTDGSVKLNTKQTLTSYHINALSACLTAIDAILDTFLGMEVSQIRCLPVFNYARVSYIVMLLLKLYFAASAPNSELGKIIDKDFMKVEQRVKSLSEKFKQIAMEDRSRPAAKFLLVLLMLKNRFLNKRKLLLSCNGGLEDIAYPGRENSCQLKLQQQEEDEQTRRQCQQPQQPRKDFLATGNTPLQLLSEVATNDPSRSQVGLQGVSSSYGTTASTVTTNSVGLPGMQQSTWGPSSQSMYIPGNTSGSGDYPLSAEAAVGGRTNSSVALETAAKSTNTLDGNHSGNGIGGSTTATGQDITQPWQNPALEANMPNYTNILGEDFEQAMSLAGFGEGSGYGAWGFGAGVFGFSVSGGGVGGGWGSGGAVPGAGIDNSSSLPMFSSGGGGGVHRSTGGQGGGAGAGGPVSSSFLAGISQEDMVDLACLGIPDMTAPGVFF